MNFDFLRLQSPYWLSKSKYKALGKHKEIND